MNPPSGGGAGRNLKDERGGISTGSLVKDDAELTNRSASMRLYTCYRK